VCFCLHLGHFQTMVFVSLLHFAEQSIGMRDQRVRIAKPRSTIFLCPTAGNMMWFFT